MTANVPSPPLSNTSLPLEIAFLTQHGFSPAQLSALAARARSLQVSAEAVVIHDGHMAAKDYYRALAGELGVPFLSEIGPAFGILDPSAAMKAGILALNGTPRDFALAPQGPSIGRLLMTSATLRSRIALTTPESLKARVRELARGRITHLAAQGLDASVSARGQASFAQGAMAAGLFLALVFCGVLEPLATLGVVGVLLGPVFLALVTLRMAAVFEPSPRNKVVRSPNEANLPIYTVLAPLFREGAVARQFVEALGRLDYPAAKLDVKILVEEADSQTRRALSALPLPPFVTVVVVPEGAPRTKPRALNAGLLEARGALLTIFDAEDMPEPGQLRAAAGIFARTSRKLACLQAHLCIDNARDSLLSRLFALEYAGLFEVINPGLTRSGLPFLLGGTSNHFRTEVLRSIGGWDAWNVTEDADLTVRLLRAGYDIGDCPSRTWEEAPVSLGNWMRQRRRWMKGFLQTAATHSRQPGQTLRDLGGARTMALASLCLGTVLSAMVYPLFLIAMGLALHEGSVLHPGSALEIIITSIALTLFGIGLLAMLGPPLVGALRQRRWDLLAVVPLVPFYTLFISIACWWALVDWVRAPFHWHKTEHGLTKRMPPQPAS